MVRIIAERCIGCAICANICPAGIEMENNVAKIKNVTATCLKEAALSCPKKAIEIEDENTKIGENANKSYNTPLDGYGALQSFGLLTGRGMGKGQGMGMGKGMGMGPRDGRGRGRGKGRGRF
ncbi:4Fe-4S binding protein [candidate division WOR-3 bacterium]|nr:4Fe-4S binding protein [candidate division WOR-3 bacterium]